MNIVPAIDLIDGACVRLQKGSFSGKTIYHKDAVSYAKELQQAGFNSLHLVDLDAARDGRSANADVIESIQSIPGFSLQMGGGLRSSAAIKLALERGIDRVVIGSLLVTDPDCVKNLINTYGANRFVLAVDVLSAQDPIVAIHGWQDASDLTLWDVLDNFTTIKGLRVLCTDISKDGMLSGPSMSVYEACIRRYCDNYILQASGGISSLSDLSALEKIGVPEVIVGKALLEKRFTYQEAQTMKGAC